jgi:acyl carrier protein phosphodiesterase
MNYLAHVLLSRDGPDQLTGAMLGDFVKGPLDGRYAPGVRAAIALHRAIDRYTDQHPLVRAARGVVSPGRRRFAGIIVDVFYDHFLACHWDRYCEMPLAPFTRMVYRTLLPQSAGFPERLQRMLPHMAREDWLSSYRELWAVEAALDGIARRFRRFEQARVLVGAIGELSDNRAVFEAGFLEFFPQLQRFVSAARGAGAPEPSGTYGRVA